MANNKEVYLTEEGLNDLKRELDELINVKRPANIQAIKEARSYGDLSENAEYDAARNEQAQIEARVKELERMLENASIIKEIKTDSVGIGNVVSVKYVTESYKESIPFTAKVEYSSSLEKGKKQIKGGVNGSRTVTVKKTYKNGVVTATETVSTVVTKPAVD